MSSGLLSFLRDSNGMFIRFWPPKGGRFCADGNDREAKPGSAGFFFTIGRPPWRSIRIQRKLFAACALLLLIFSGQSGAADDNRPRPPGPSTDIRAEFRRPTEIPFPDDNQYSEAKAVLGRKLFFDPLLSGAGSLSCASCHNPGLSWGDGLPTAVGWGGQSLPLRSPTLLNVAWLSAFGWDGKFDDLESVAFVPLLAPKNMHQTERKLIDKLISIPAYVEGFRAAFGNDGITRRTIELALATFERMIVSGQAPFDRWIGGDETAISEAAKRGFDLFNGKANCALCHPGWNFTEGAFYDIGLAREDDVGRGRAFPQSIKLRNAFKVPTLRDVARRAPFMHDGSLADLDAVIAFYDSGGRDRPSRSDLIRPLGLTERERAELRIFLETLTQDPMPFPVPVLPR